MTMTEGERTHAGHATAVARRALTSPVFLAWIVSRAISTVVLMVLGSRTPPHPDITRMVTWDGNWYQAIAHTGYGPPPRAGQWSAWPFFPLFPGITRLLHAL